MARPKDKPRYLTSRLGADGTVRWYWQPSKALQDQGYKLVRLPDDPVQARAEAIRRNADLDANRSAPALAAPVAADLLDSVIARYQASDAFIQLSPRSKRDYRLYLKKLSDWAGDLPLSAITPPDVQSLGRALAATPAARSYCIRVGSALAAWAIRHGITAAGFTNPFVRSGLSVTSVRVRVWSLAERDCMIAHADALGWPSVGDAILLAHQLGQRQGDVLTLPWIRWQQGRIRLQQGKTAARVDLPVTEELAVRLLAARARAAATGCTSPYIVAPEQGRGRWSDKRPDKWRGDTFTHTFARIRAAAADAAQCDEDQAVTAALDKQPSLLGTPASDWEPEVPPVWFQDLRDTAVTELADAGCTIPEIIAVTGHSPQSATTVLKHYMAPTTDQATAAMAKRVRRSGGADGA